MMLAADDDPDLGELGEAGTDLGGCDFGDMGF